MSDNFAVSLLQGNWFLRNEPKLELTASEQAFIVAALGQAPQRWHGQPDEARMAELLGTEPDLLNRIGSRLLGVAIGMRGCGPTVKLLLERGVALAIDTSAYNVLHEAAWAGATDTLKAVFESGASDATPVSIKKPHTGWPDNLSLMYWVAWGGYPDLARLLIEHGVGVHHQLQIRGNGERGTTSLHEAVAPGPLGGGQGAALKRRQTRGRSDSHRRRRRLRRLRRLWTRRCRPAANIDRSRCTRCDRRRRLPNDAAALGGKGRRWSLCRVARG